LNAATSRARVLERHPTPPTCGRSRSGSSAKLTSPNRIRRQGWGPNDLLPGEKVTFEGYGGRVVESRGSLLSITKVGENIPLFEEGGPETAGQQRPDDFR